jgi:hypothetical protein
MKAWMDKKQSILFVRIYIQAIRRAEIMAGKYRIFVSYAQKQLAAERRAVHDFVEGDALQQRFFDVFLFEDLPA